MELTDMSLLKLPFLNIFKNNFCVFVQSNIWTQFEKYNHHEGSPKENQTSIATTFPHSESCSLERTIFICLCFFFISWCSPTHI